MDRSVALKGYVCLHAGSNDMRSMVRRTVSSERGRLVSIMGFRNGLGICAVFKVNTVKG